MSWHLINNFGETSIPPFNFVAGGIIKEALYMIDKINWLRIFMSNSNILLITKHKRLLS
jgi:hypothetical protein